MSFVKRHPVVIFFLLAYALSWGAIPWNSFFAPGVLVSAVVVVSLTEGLAGLKAMGSRLIRWRVSWVWYALAVAVPLLIHLLTASLNGALGASMPAFDQFKPWYSLPMAIGLNIINPTGGQLSEEPSLRGFAQVKLQSTRTPLLATAIMAVAVTIWHAPLFFMPVFHSSPIEALGTVAVTFWYAWLFNHAGGSSLITLIAHSSEGSVETSTLWSSAADTTRETWLYCSVWWALVIGLLLANRHFWLGKPRVGGTDTEARTSVPVDSAV